MGSLLKSIESEIFKVTPGNFEPLALKVFQFQYESNEVYRQYCIALKINPAKVNSLSEIPFLPIQFFKTKQIKTTLFEPEVIFESSGTTGSVPSKHFVKDLSLYEKSFLKTFNIFYGDVKDWCIIGLLPSYLEKENSSLVWMVNDLIEKSAHPQSGFYLYDFEKLHTTLIGNEKLEQPTLLIGVTYALLDFTEQYKMKLQHTIVIETGGMKGRRKELTRQEVHNQINQNLGINEVHSEYGMTELLSQAYSKKDGLFICPPWMKVFLRKEDDPLEIILPTGISAKFETGGVNITDLANIYSCAFIATDDMGKLYRNESFEIIGRMVSSDQRGCSLMVAEWN